MGQPMIESNLNESNMDGSISIAVATGGHPFVEADFFAVFDEMEGVRWQHFPQPRALELVDPAHHGEFDVLVMYDMPGIEFTGGDPPAVLHGPPDGYIESYGDMVWAGQPMVFLHHAVASWPAWEGFGQMVGGRFHYQPASFAGVDYPDSGYRHDVTHRVEVVDPDHPICAGLEPSFEITDELYLFPVLGDSVEPLMRSTATFDAGEFYSADLAIRGRRNERDGWVHPSGSNLVAWTRRVGNSPIAYVQFGDGPQTYADPNYRLVLRNAIAWAATTLA